MTTKTAGGPALSEAAFPDLDASLVATIGRERASMIRCLDSIFARTHQGPWQISQDGIHPAEVGGMGTDDCYAICAQFFGPLGDNHQHWVVYSHNEWPFVRALLTELAETILVTRDKEASHG